jgi:hypothetical protein
MSTTAKANACIYCVIGINYMRMSIVKLQPPSPQEQLVQENYPANLDAISEWENVGRPLAERFHPWNGWPSLNVLVMGKGTDEVQDFLLNKDVQQDHITLAGVGRGSSRPIEDAIARSEQNIYDFGALHDEQLKPGSFDLVIAYNALSSLSEPRSRLAVQNISRLLAGKGKGVLMLIEPNPAYNRTILPDSIRRLFSQKRSNGYEAIFKEHGVVTPRGIKELNVYLPLDHPEYQPYDRSKAKISPTVGAIFFKPPKAEDY